MKIELIEFVALALIENYNNFDKYVSRYQTF